MTQTSDGLPDTKMPEEWRPILGFDGYEASNRGRVRSWLIVGNKKRANEPHIIASRIYRGYERCVLRANGRQRTLFTHRAVLLAFQGAPPSGHESRHLNGNSLDNRLDNLAWATHRENDADKVRHGTSAIGSRGMRRKLVPEQVLAIRAAAAGGRSLADLGREYGVTWQSIQAIVRRRSWKTV